MTDPPSETRRVPELPAWRLAISLSVVLLALFVWRALPTDADPAATASHGEGAVFVRLVRPEGPAAESVVGWSDGLTVRRATELAYQCSWRGRGSMAFLESLDGSPNQGPDGLNWQFEVNGEYATRGAGAATLEAGDGVLWKLAPYE